MSGPVEGDMVRITGDGYAGLVGPVASIQLGDGLGSWYFVESPHSGCLIGPLRRDEIEPVGLV